jgi:hypothetical protein
MVWLCLKMKILMNVILAVKLKLNSLIEYLGPCRRITQRILHSFIYSGCCFRNKSTESSEKFAETRQLVAFNCCLLHHLGRYLDDCDIVSTRNFWFDQNLNRRSNLRKFVIHRWKNSYSRIKTALSTILSLIKYIQQI